jgi:hypothetical protein
VNGEGQTLAGVIRIPHSQNARRLIADIAQRVICRPRRQRDQV